MTTAPQKNNVATKSAAVMKMAAAWDLVTTLMGGTAAMRAAGAVYLPQWPSEAAESYKERLAQSTLFPAFKRTAVTLAARPFSRPITLGDNVPPRFEPWLEDIDMQGNSLDSFASETFKLQMAYGLVGILVEHPKRPEGAVTQADDLKFNLRPYFVRVRADQILGWRTKSENGSITLSQLRIKEEVEEDDGDFGTKCVDQVRVLEIGKWSTFRKSTAAGTVAVEEWKMHDSGTTTLKTIPFVLLYGERTGFMTAKPPLLELAHLNVKHWQQQSDQDNLMHVARVPILTARAVGDKFKLVVGSSAAVNLGDDPHAEMNFVEHTGAAIGAGKTQLDDLKEEMRQSGAELLVLKPGPTTATEVASDNAVGMCALQEMTAMAEDGLEQALQLMADYVAEPDGGGLELFKDFAAASLAEASAQLLASLTTSGKLSAQTLISELKRRGILSPEVTWEDEQDRLSAEGPPEGNIDPITSLPYTSPVDLGNPAAKIDPHTGLPYTSPVDPVAMAKARSGGK